MVQYKQLKVIIGEGYNNFWITKIENEEKVLSKTP